MKGSCGRSLRCGVVLGYQLGPYPVPVLRAQVAAGDGAGGGLLDGMAMRDGHRPDFGGPLRHQHAVDAKGGSQIDHSTARSRIQIGLE